jgi:hypothetical protein
VNVKTKQGLYIKPFSTFHDKLEKNGFVAHEGKITDASFVEMPPQRNSKEEKH